MLTWELPSANVMTSSCAGEVTAEFMLMSLMMKSGLYHHPAAHHDPSAHVFVSCTGNNLPVQHTRKTLSLPLCVAGSST